MNRKLAFGFLSAVLAFALGANSVAADEKVPDPLKDLVQAAKNLTREAREGYAASVEVEGGLSKAKDHKLYTTTVRESYSGDIKGNLMHVPSMRAFRTTEKGALFDGAQWYTLNAQLEGKKLDRLFEFPILLLANAVKNPKKIEWLPSTVKLPDTEREISSGTTVEKELTKNQLYHRIRVEVPDKEALSYFIEVQNSGCLSGG